jgi:hypothetical protein
VSKGHRRFFSESILKAFAHFQSKMDWSPERVQHARRQTVRRLGGWSYAPNGDREVERRRRQIAAGQLKRENGLRDE